MQTLQQQQGIYQYPAQANDPRFGSQPFIPNQWQPQPYRSPPYRDQEPPEGYMPQPSQMQPQSQPFVLPPSQSPNYPVGHPGRQSPVQDSYNQSMPKQKFRDSQRSMQYPPDVNSQQRNPDPNSNNQYAQPTRALNSNLREKSQFYQLEGKSVASMPNIRGRQNLVSDLSADDLSSDREATGSKVWGNSVLSANHETPIDLCIEPSDEDLMEIRQFAANTEIKQFLRKNNLEAFEGLLQRCFKDYKSLTLQELAKFDAVRISMFCSQQYISTLEDGQRLETPTTEQINRFVDALQKYSVSKGHN